MERLPERVVALQACRGAVVVKGPGEDNVLRSMLLRINLLRPS